MNNQLNNLRASLQRNLTSNERNDITLQFITYAYQHLTNIHESINSKQNEIDDLTTEQLHLEQEINKYSEGNIDAQIQVVKLQVQLLKSHIECDESNEKLSAKLFNLKQLCYRKLIGLNRELQQTKALNETMICNQEYGLSVDRKIKSIEDEIQSLREYMNNELDEESESESGIEESSENNESSDVYIDDSSDSSENNANDDQLNDASDDQYSNDEINYKRHKSDQS